MKQKKEVINEALLNCLEDLYHYAVPTTSYAALLEAHKNGLPYDKEYWAHHYIPEKLLREIVDHYKYAYCLEDYFKDYTDVLKKYLLEGGTTEIYVKDDSLVGGRREYTKTPKLGDVIGKEATDKVADLIDKCQKFYRFDWSRTGGFEFEIFNCGPCCNAESVTEYWKTQDVEVDCDDEKIMKNFYKEEYGEDDDEDLGSGFDDELN